MDVAVELPKYKCHKKVKALKISRIVHNPNPDLSGTSKAQSYGAVLHFKELANVRIEVSADYMIKHSPEEGGYYVQYEDGYESYSPAKAFEEGYSRIEEGDNGEETFTRSDLVSFGKYLLSQRRFERLRDNREGIYSPENHRSVYDADLANWEDEHKKQS